MQSLVRTVALVTLAAVAAAAHADIVHLKGGGKVEGEILEDEGGTVVVSVRGGRISVDRARVERIEKTPPREPSPGDAAVEATVVRTGKRFRVVAHFPNDAFADAALAAAEAAWPATTALLGVTMDAPERPLEVHVYADAAEFAVADARFSGGIVAAGLPAFTDPTTRTAHVLVTPVCAPMIWRRIGPSRSFSALVAHETSHLAEIVCLANGPSHPRWLAEGIAQHVEDTFRDAGPDGAAAGASVATSSQMDACKRLRREGLLPEPRAILQERLDHLSSYDRYAVQWAFFGLLLEPAQRARTDKLLAELRELKPGDDFAARAAAVAESVWGAKGLDELNEALRARVDAFVPAWSVDGRAAMDVAGERWIQWAGDDAAGRVFRPGPPGRAEFRVTGQVEVLAGKVSQVEIDFGRGESGFVAVFLSSTEGVWVAEYRASDDSWHTIEGESLDPVRFATTTDFDVTVAGESVRVRVGGKDAAAVKLPGRDLSGAWGVGVYAGTAALWTGVTLR